jgi:hypothetical protein
VRHVHQTDLAWALIDVVKPHMSVGERNYAFVTIGAGDLFAAICSLIKFVAAKHIPLRPELLRQCARWLDGYVLHDDHEALRRIIEGVLPPNSIQFHAAIRRAPARPKPPPPLILSAKYRTKRRTSVRSAHSPAR